MLEKKERIEQIKKNFSITEYEEGNKKYEAITGITADDVRWVVNELHSLIGKSE